MVSEIFGRFADGFQSRGKTAARRWRSKSASSQLFVPGAKGRHIVVTNPSQNSVTQSAIILRHTYNGPFTGMAQLDQIGRFRLFATDQPR